MKHQSKLLLTLLHGAGVGALLSSGAMVSTDAEAGISNTKHNLGGGITNTNRVTGGATNEICVFCHTPHGADVSNTEANPPLWNKRLDTAAVYTTYAQLGTSTLDAASNASGTATTGSISLACLSCHDGSQAMDNIINAPGSGQWDTTGGGDNGRSSGTLWAWSQGGEGFIGSGVTNLTGDLRNDHPIGIAYCGGNTGSYISDQTTGCRDSDFHPPKDAGNNRWYVETNAATGKDKSDMILYWRAMASTTSAPSVECGSCHDPHVETKATNQTAFMRISQANSGVCLACHNK